MAYEFKKLSDVNVIEEMNDGLNVLVEDGGEIVKIAACDMIPSDVALKSDIPSGVVKSINGEVPDESGNVQMSGLPEGANPWHQLVTNDDGVAMWEQKPFYTVTDTWFSWDGDQTGLSETNYTQMYMRYCGPFDMPEAYPVGAMMYGSNYVNYDGHLITEDDIYQIGNGSCGIWGGGAQTPIVVVAEADVGTSLTLWQGEGGASTYTCSFPSQGMWIGKYSTSPGVSRVAFENNVTLDERYIPDTIVRIADLPKAAAVADAAGDTPTAAEFNALLAALRNAGLLATE